jgi:hypothetical protein
MQLLGRAQIKYNGKLLRTEKNAKVNTGGVTRKGQAGDRVHGYSEETAIPFIECEVALAKGDSLLELNKATDVTVTFEADTGQTWVLKDAWLVDPAEASAGEGGKVKLKFEGMTCEEMK